MHAYAANFPGNTTSGSNAPCGCHAHRSVLTVALAVVFVLAAAVFALALAFTVACTSACTAAFVSVSVYTSVISQHHPTSSADVHLFSVSLL